MSRGSVPERELRILGHLSRTPSIWSRDSPCRNMLLGGVSSAFLPLGSFSCQPVSISWFADAFAQSVFSPLGVTRHFEGHR
jgi:hypothetical protein